MEHDSFPTVIIDDKGPFFTLTEQNGRPQLKCIKCNSRLLSSVEAIDKHRSSAKHAVWETAKNWRQLYE